jgi:hypothetical protein
MARLERDLRLRPDDVAVDLKGAGQTWTRLKRFSHPKLPLSWI